MHIKKSLAVVGAAAAIGALSLKAQWSDNDAQAKARAALRQKMAEENGQTPAATNAPSSPPPAGAPKADAAERARELLRQSLATQTPSPAPAPGAPKTATQQFEQTGKLPPAASVVAAPALAPAAAPNYVPIKPTPEQEAQMREQVRQSIAQLNGGAVQPQPQPVVSALPRPANALSAEDEARVRAALHQALTQPPATTASAPIQPGVTAAVPIVSTPSGSGFSSEQIAAIQKAADARVAAAQQEAAARVAAIEKAANERVAAAEKNAAMLKAAAEARANADQLAAQKAAGARLAAEKARGSTDASVLEVGGLMASSSAAVDMTPGSKGRRLYDLLVQYKADEITPVEYHEKRAKILSENN